MKTKALVLSLALSLCAASVALAGDKDKDSKETKSPPPAKTKPAKKDEVTKKQSITGSYIKRDIKKNGRITNGPDNVNVIDQDMISTSGAAQLSEVLIRKGIR